jgi:hypothetical protein
MNIFAKINGLLDERKGYEQKGSPCIGIVKHVLSERN